MLVNKTKRAQKNIEALCCFPQLANQIAFIYSSAAFKQEIIQQIRQAKNRIYITALYWQNDEAGEEILQEVYAAKRRQPQLDVRIFVDWHRGQRNLLGAEKSETNADWYCAKREENNTEHLFFGVPVNTREVFGVLHIKGFIFDDTILYSGASINNVYLHQLEKYRYDRYHKIINSALAESMAEFIIRHLAQGEAVYPLDDVNRPQTKEIRSNIRAYRKSLSQASYDLTGCQKLNNELSITPLFGLGNDNELNRTIEDLFLMVQESLVICTPYFNFPRTLQQKLKRLLTKGKKVEIIVGDKKANDFYIPPEQPFKIAGALPYLYERNLRAFSKKFESEITQGQLIVRTWQDGDNSYHLKGIWVDNQYILLTGNNLNPRAWRLDAENAFLLHDPKQELQEQIQTELNHIRENTQILQHFTELEELEDYPEPVQKLLKKFARVKADKLVKLIL